MAQCFSSANVATTPIVPIDDGDTNSHPCVAIAPDGTFVVTYLSNLVPSTESNIGLEIRARMFSAAGAPLGTSFVVNAEPYIPPWQTVNTFGRSRIGMRSDKTFVIVWSEWTNATNAFFIYGQRFDAAGVKVWPVNFLISGDASVLVPPNKHDPDVDIADNGDFVVVWDSEDAGTHAAYGRRYNAAGTAYAPEFKINQTTHTMSNVGVYPRVSVAANGLFVAVWHRFPAPALNAFGVFARRYNASGVAQGGEFQVNTTLNSLYRWYPDVACDRDGNFTVVWQSFDNPDNPYTQDNGIIARQYNAAGTATTGEYVVNNPTLSASLGIGDQISPAVTRKAGSGAWVTAWEGLQGVPPSGGVYNIWHSQIIGNPLPITSWTLTAPISGSYPHGTLLTVQWVAYGVQAGNNINLCYITTIDWSGTSHWVKFGGAISNGAGYWNWDTTGVPPGTYYIAGYIWNGAPVYAHATTTFIIT